MHAISHSSDLPKGVTLPTSRTFSDEKAKKVIEEMNIHKRSREIIQFAACSYVALDELLRRFYERYGYVFLCFGRVDST